MSRSKPRCLNSSAPQGLGWLIRVYALAYKDSTEDSGATGLPVDVPPAILDSGDYDGQFGYWVQDEDTLQKGL